MRHTDKSVWRLNEAGYTPIHKRNGCHSCKHSDFRNLCGTQKRIYCVKARAEVTLFGVCEKFAAERTPEKVE